MKQTLKKSPNDARQRQAVKRRVGNTSTSSDLAHGNPTLGTVSRHFDHDQGQRQHERRGFAPHVESPMQSGSSHLFLTPGYGPCRRPTSSLKVLGGAILHTSAAASSQADPAAPGSSISEQLPKETATFGTSAIQALTKMLNLVEEEDTRMSFEQQALFDLRLRDLTTSSQTYSNQQTLHNGQQLLMDLKRMQNLVHKHLNVPGEVEHSVANIFVISQCLTSILQNPKNQCFDLGDVAGLGLLLMTPLRRGGDHIKL